MLWGGCSPTSPPRTHGNFPFYFFREPFSPRVPHGFRTKRFPSAVGNRAAAREFGPRELKKEICGDIHARIALFLLLPSRFSLLVGGGGGPAWGTFECTYGRHGAGSKTPRRRASPGFVLGISGTQRRLLNGEGFRRRMRLNCARAIFMGSEYKRGKLLVNHLLPHKRKLENTLFSPTFGLPPALRSPLNF